MNCITIETADHVTTITLNRPEVMNAINGEMHHELQAAFDEGATGEDLISAAGDAAEDQAPPEAGVAEPQSSATRNSSQQANRNSAGNSTARSVTSASRSTR